MPGDVGVAQDVGFELQIFQPMFDDIAMLVIPASLPSRSTGMWRTRWRVIRFMTRLHSPLGKL